jgi:hypothetical protein
MAEHHVTIQRWKQCIWLSRWFALQALQCQKPLCLQLLCRGASAYVCWFGVIVDHLQPRPTKPPTQRSSVILPGSWSACRYHKGGRHNKTIVLVIARVKGIGPVLPILEGGRCVCPFVSGLHRLLWQHRIFVLGPGGQCLHPTSLPTKLPQLSNTFTAPTSVISPSYNRCQSSHSLSKCMS